MADQPRRPGGSGREPSQRVTVERAAPAAPRTTTPMGTARAKAIADAEVETRVSSETSRQQKFLQYGMPLMFGVMSFFFPAGLTLYIFTNTCLSALHSIYMNKYDKKSLEIAAMLKKNQAAAEAAKNPPKKVIDAESKDVDEDGDDDDNEEAAPKGAPNKPATARVRRPNKKRRR